MIGDNHRLDTEIEHLHELLVAPRIEAQLTASGPSSTGD
jgi:hypothetical protein